MLRGWRLPRVSASSPPADTKTLSGLAIAFRKSEQASAVVSFIDNVKPSVRSA
jgi:hypothetical protein